MNTPNRIYIGTRDGENLAIVDKNYPNAREYISKDAVIRRLTIAKVKYGGNIAAAIYDIEKT